MMKVLIHQQPVIKHNLKMLKTRIVLITCLLYLIIPSINGQLLWEITKPNQPTSYLFGTHHLIPKSILDDKSCIELAYKNSDIVIGEIDIKEMQDPISMNYYMNAMQLSEKLTLENLISERNIIVIQSVLKEISLNIPKSVFIKMHPAALSLIITSNYSSKYIQEMYNANETSIDVYIQQLATNDNKSIIALETLKYQTDILLKSKSLEEFSKELIDVCEGAKSGRLDIETKNLIELYLNEDIYSILKITEEQNADTSYKLSANEIDLLINKRNILWTKKLANSYLPSNSCFIAVGALHLPGKEGLLTLLEKEGYKVTAIKAH